MISRDNLIGWLCFLRLNIDHEPPIYLPNQVRDALVAEGWMTVGEKFDGVEQTCHVTDAGATVSDLACPEWGIDPIPVEED